MKFEVGNIGEWESQAKSYSKLKVGKCLAVIPKGESAKVVAQNIINSSPGVYVHSNVSQWGSERDHESYIFEVAGRTEQNRKRLYWPKVLNLKKWIGVV